MKIWHWTVFIVTAVVLLAGCHSNQVTGNGKRVTTTRSVQDFNNINLKGAYKIKVTQGNSQSIKITTDANIIPFVITEVKDNQLYVHNKRGISFNLTQPIFIHIVVNKLQQIMASGANKLVLSAINSENLRLNTNGSIQADLSGQVDNLSMNIAGSGNVNAGNLLAKVVKVRMTGSGDVIVNAADKLDTKITGSGKIQYSGNPYHVVQSIIGSGTLEHVK